MKRIKAPPGARRLIQSLRDLGYDCSTAIADLVDNSIAARASEIHIQILAQDGSRPPAIVIADNGAGMDEPRLQEAMRFGAFQEYTSEDLGKYGLGLKTASISQCRVLTVASTARVGHGTQPSRCYARWDLGVVKETDEWDLLLPTPENLEPWELSHLHHELAARHGTVVLWTGLEGALPFLADHDFRKRDRFLSQLIDEVGDHLRMVFHRFMDGTVEGRARLRIRLCGLDLQPWDPFCRKERTRSLGVLKLPVSFKDADGREGTETVTVSPCLLPSEDEFSTYEAWKDASGPRGWNQQQGFYFYRNHRLLQAGGWSYLRSVDEHTKLLRVGVDFPSEMDRDFKVNITKMRALVPAELKDALRAAASKWVKPARERYTHVSPPVGRDGDPPAERPGAGGKHRATGQSSGGAPKATFGGLSLALSNAPGESLTVAPGATGSQVRIVVPHSHATAAIFQPGVAGHEDSDFYRLTMAMLSVLEVVYEQRLKADKIPLESLRRSVKKIVSGKTRHA